MIPPPSPAGPVGDDVPIRMPPRRPYGRYAQTFRFLSNPLGSNLAARRDFGDVWQLHLLTRSEPFIATCHPDHVRSLFMAAPVLLEARDEDGIALTDRELRDELMTLVLAGHETTATALAWTFERLLRTPPAYDRLRELVRAGDESYVEATINEAMRNRPVIPMVVRMVKRRWRFGDYVVPGGTPAAISIAALHHREDVYADPLVFRPERFLSTKPGTYTWIPFGGGIRRCLGATLAIAEQRVVVRAIATLTDLAAPDPAPERPRQRNVTMIPHRGGRVVVLSKRRTRRHRPHRAGARLDPAGRTCT